MMRRWPGIPPLFDSETERGQPPGHTPLRPTLIHAAHFRPPPHVTAAVQAAAQRNHPKLEWCPRCKRRVAGIGLLGLFNRLGSRPRSALSVSAPSQPVTAGWRGQSATCQRVTATRAGPTPPSPSLTGDSVTQNLDPRAGRAGSVMSRRAATRTCPSHPPPSRSSHIAISPGRGLSGCGR